MSSTRAPQPLHPSVRTVWRLQLALYMAILLFVALAVDIGRYINEATSFPQPGLLTILTLFFGTALILVVPAFRYRYWRYALLPEELYLERGLFVRVRTIVPLRRIQHIDVSQNLFEREFGLGTLVVHTAGAQSGDIALPGLLNEDAERLRDEVKEYILQDVGA